MNNLTSLPFWFNPRPEPVSYEGEQVLIGIIAGLIILSIIIALQAYPEKWSIYRPTIQKLIPFSITNSFVSLYFIFVNQQLIPFFRTRFLYIIWAIISILWLWSIIKKGRQRLERRETLAKEAERQKYLP